MLIQDTARRYISSHRLCLVFASLSCLIFQTLGAEVKTPNELEEFQAKALLVYNIAKFVIWPDGAFANHPDTFTINIVGENPFDGAFYFLDEKKIQGLEVAVRHNDTLTFPHDSQVVYVDSADLEAFTKVLPRLQAQNILVVTSNRELFNSGAMVCLSVKDDQLSFAVNLDSAHKADLEISGNLLRHADTVIFEGTAKDNTQ